MSHPFVEIFFRPPKLSNVTTDTIIRDNKSFIVTFENPDKILPLIFGEDRSVLVTRFLFAEILGTLETPGPGPDPINEIPA